MPVGYRKPGANSTPEECRRFVDEKYIRKAFSPAGYPEPVKELLACRTKGTKPSFGFSKDKSSQQQQEEAQQEEQNIREKQQEYKRKKSMSLDKLPRDNQNHKHQDLLSPDDDLLGGGAPHDGNDFGEFTQAHSASPVKKVNFANFKKAQHDQQQGQTESTQQNQVNWDWNVQSGPTNNTNNQLIAPEHNVRSHSEGEQKQAEAKVDLMKLYNQGPMTHHQNHFMQSGHMQQGWGYNNGGNYGWNNNMNGGFNNGQMGHQGYQNGFQGGFNAQHQQQNFGHQNFGQQMGYNQTQPNYGGNMGGAPNVNYGQGYNMGYNQGAYNQYANTYQNNGFVQAQAGNKFF
jgi:hypothetical protein